MYCHEINISFSKMQTQQSQFAMYRASLLKQGKCKRSFVPCANACTFSLFCPLLFPNLSNPLCLFNRLASIAQLTLSIRMIHRLACDASNYTYNM